MTATNTSKPAKDGTGTAFTKEMAVESVSTNIAEKFYIGDPATESLVTVATAAKQPALGTAGTASTDVITVQGISGGVAQPVSVATVPLPTGAATSAKQPALGTAGTPSSDVITVQGKDTNIPIPVSNVITNPTSVLTRPANTTAYTQNNLIGSSVTAGSVVVPSFVATRVTGGNTMVRALRLVTNATGGWGSKTVSIDLWTAAPTFTNGDGGAYAPATGAAGWLGTYIVTLTQFGDGAVGRASISNSTELGLALASGQLVYWSMQITSSAGATPISGQTFTLTAEDYLN